MMFEKYVLRAVHCRRAVLLAVFSLLTLSTGLVGCASSSGADKGADEKVSGQPPSAEEDTPKSLPNGPKVEIGRAESDEASEDAGAEADSEASADFTRSEVDGFMQKGSAYALTLVDVKPSRADGAFQGFEITTMAPAAADVVGPQLQVGDVITHINGVRMQKPDDYLSAWKLLGEVSKIRIDFLRDGASQHAVWHVQ